MSKEIEESSIFRALNEHINDPEIKKYEDRFIKINRIELIELMIGLDVCKSRTTAANIYVKLKKQGYITKIPYFMGDVEGVDIAAVRSELAKLKGHYIRAPAPARESRETPSHTHITHTQVPVCDNNTTMRGSQ